MCQILYLADFVIRASEEGILFSLVTKRMFIIKIFAPSDRFSGQIQSGKSFPAFLQEFPAGQLIMPELYRCSAQNHQWFYSFFRISVWDHTLLKELDDSSTDTIYPRDRVHHEKYPLSPINIISVFS